MNVPFVDLELQHEMAKEAIDEAIQRVAPGAPKNNDERRLWILNDEGLYNWARAEGVKI